MHKTFEVPQNIFRMTQIRVNANPKVTIRINHLQASIIFLNSHAGDVATMDFNTVLGMLA
jgi:hypothetical protein